jgi:hypothetical protein
MEKQMKMNRKTTSCIVHSIAAAVLVLSAQFSLASSATWLLSPQDSAWENAANWTPGGPPNGPSDTATFAQSSQADVNISTSEEVNSIVFTSNSASYYFSISWPGQLIISGTGVTNNSSVSQGFEGYGGQLIFNNTSTAAGADMSIFNGSDSFGSQGYTIFNDASSAAGASITNTGSFGGFFGPDAPGATIFNGTSTAGHATITNVGPFLSLGSGGSTSFNDSSTAGNATLVAEIGDDTAEGSAIVFNDASSAGNAILIANGSPDGDDYATGGNIIFNDVSTGGTARVEVFYNGYVDTSGRRPGVTIGSIEGSGNVFLGTNRLTVGANNINTSFSGLISGSGLLSKIGSGVLTLQTNHCIADTVGLILASGSIINLHFTGPPDVVASLVVDGVRQPPRIYGGPMSGAPNVLPEFAGSGTVSVGPISILGNISTRAFVQTDDNVVIGGFIVQGTEAKRVIIRAIGPELGAPPYNVPNALANPTLELHDANGALLASNNNWGTTIIGGIITANQVHDIQTSGYAPGHGFESAIIANLAPGNYTAIVRGVNDMTGVGLVEVYDLSPDASSILANISTRAFVQTGDNVMIGGFIVQTTQPKRVIIRAIGPELTQYGVPNALADPTLELHDGTGALIASNDNWMTTVIGGIITSNQVADIRNSGHAPTDTRESAIIATLPAGNYTAIVRGVNETTGVGLVEVYDLDQ